MKLSQKQEWLVARYLRAVAQEVGDVPQAARERAIARLKGHILKSLRELGKAPLPDPEVTAALDELGTPAEVARLLLKSPAPGRRPGPAAADRVWLGVCANLAGRWDTTPRALRLGAVVAGLITGPLALIAYLGLFAEMYASSPPEARPRVDGLKVFKAAAGGIAAAVAMHVGTRVALRLIEEAYLRVLARDVLPDLAGWEWLRADQSFLLFCALFLCTPWLALGSLPMANAWDETSRRLGQAGLAIYAMVLSLGIASHLVGILLLVVRDLAP